MGFFSWLTADTNESVSNSYSDRGARPVFLLQPGGLDPISEPNYEGYGRFGDIDAYHWLALANLDKATIASIESDVASGRMEVSDFMRGKPIQDILEETLRDIGCALDMGSYYRDAETGETITVYHRIPDVVQRMYDLKLRHLKVTYDVPLADFDGQSPNELVASGRLVKIDLPRPANTIKLSFDEAAVYEDLPESPNCPEQGYFYPTDEDDEPEEFEDEPEEDEDDCDERLDEAA